MRTPHHPVVPPRSGAPSEQPIWTVLVDWLNTLLASCECGPTVHLHLDRFEEFGLAGLNHAIGCAHSGTNCVNPEASALSTLIAELGVGRKTAQ